MQVGFKAWQDILNGKDTNDLYYSFYTFFMIASCSIVLKVIIFIFNNYSIIEAKVIFFITKIIWMDKTK